MASVFLATELDEFDPFHPYKSFIALKQLFPKYSAQQGFVKCLVDEAKLTSMLKHPNVVEVLDLGNVGTDFYLTMNWVNGKSLHQLLQTVRQRNKVISKSFLFYIFQKVARGLHYAHELKDSANRPLDMVHCDISPQNILIGYEGEVKLSDFGIATAEKSKEQASNEALLGKLPYMAPEQITLKGFDKRVDIYAFGVLMYEGLTGKKPLDAMTVHELQTKIVKDVPSYTSKVFAAHPRVHEFIASCLEKDPNNRPSSISEFFKLQDEIGDVDEIKISKLMKLLFQEEIKKEKENIQMAVQIMVATRAQDDLLSGDEEYSFSQEKSGTQMIPNKNEKTQVVSNNAPFEMTKVSFNEDEKEQVGKVELKKKEVVRVIKKKPVEEEWIDAETTQRRMSREMLEAAAKAEVAEKMDTEHEMEDVFDGDLDEKTEFAPSSEKTVVDFDASKWLKPKAETKEKEKPKKGVEVSDNTDSQVEFDAVDGIENSEAEFEPDKFEANYPKTGEVSFSKHNVDEAVIHPEAETKEARIQLKVVRKPLSEVKMDFSNYSTDKDKQTNEEFFQEISKSRETELGRDIDAPAYKIPYRGKEDAFTFQIKKRTLLLLLVIAAIGVGIWTSHIKNPLYYFRSQAPQAFKDVHVIDLYISVQDLENSQEKSSIALWMDPAFQQSFISPIQAFFLREYQSYTKKDQLPFRFVFSGLERGTPQIPWQGGLFNSYLPFDKFSGIFQLDPHKSLQDHGRLFIHLFSKPVNTPSEYPIDYQGSRPTHQGVLYYPMFSETDNEFQLRLAHEILHMLGARDLYNDRGLPKYPDGYVEPFKEPLHPQKFGEIMSRSIAENPSEYIPLSSLEDARIGASTAYDIGWITEQQKNDFFQR